MSTARRRRIGGGPPRALRAALRRLGRAVVVLVGISLVTFALLRLLPGDPALVGLAGGDGRGVPPEVYRAFRERAGLDRPAWQQYLAWAGEAVSGDLGRSFADGRPVSERLGERLPATLLLNGTALALVYALAVPLGVALARRREAPVDQAARWGLFLLFALPSFWAAGILQGVFSVRLGWLPLHGSEGPGLQEAGAVARVVDLARHALLPVVCLAYGQLAFLTRFTRATVLESLGEDFIRTARAKGLAEGQVMRRHALRHAAVALLTLTGLTLPALVGGSVIIESIFGWPGLGELFYRSVTRRDYPVVLALTLLGAALTLAGNLAADMLYRAADPRARQGAG